MPALANWFPGTTPAVMDELTCRQIIDCFRFMSENQPKTT